ncbi:zinc ribbon domain-containing protein [Candidatus Woesearchaeota archaeon]|nr:zinc ribbon domain-containing protein [Candidatus Woesearchaeota archaeon]
MGKLIILVAVVTIILLIFPIISAFQAEVRGFAGGCPLPPDKIHCNQDRRVRCAEDTVSAIIVEDCVAKGQICQEDNRGITACLPPGQKLSTDTNSNIPFFLMGLILIIIVIIIFFIKRKTKIKKSSRKESNFCSNCGTELSEHIKLCPKCGEAR